MPDSTQPDPTPLAVTDGPRLPARVFISYASDDRDIAKRLFEQLTDAGALHVWWDSRNVRGADLWKNEIDEGLLRSQVVIAVLTRKSVDPERTWVNYELDHASKLLRTIIPCLFEPEKAFMSEGLLPKRFKSPQA